MSRMVLVEASGTVFVLLGKMQNPLKALVWQIPLFVLLGLLPRIILLWGHASSQCCSLRFQPKLWESMWFSHVDQSIGVRQNRVLTSLLVSL